MSINADSGHHLPLKLQQEWIFTRTQSLRLPHQNLQAANLLSCSAHISGALREAEIADHHSPDDYFGNIFPPKKSSCDSQNIFLPPLPMTFKVVLLLPAVLNGCHEMCSHPWWFVLAHTHARTHAPRESTLATVEYRKDWCLSLLPPRGQTRNCGSNLISLFGFVLI